MLAPAHSAVSVTSTHDDCSPEPVTCDANYQTSDEVITSESAQQSVLSWLINIIMHLKVNLTMSREEFTRTAGVVQRHSIPGISQIDIHCFFLHKRPAVHEPMLSSLEASALSDLACVLLQPTCMRA